MGSSTRKSISVPVVMHMDSSSSFITYSTISICMSRFFTFVSTHTLQGIFILLRPLSKSPDLQLSIFLMGLRIPSLCICQTIINDSLSPFLLYLQLLKHFFYFEFHPSRYVHLSIETFTFSLLLSIILWSFLKAPTFDRYSSDGLMVVQQNFPFSFRGISRSYNIPVVILHFCHPQFTQWFTSC